ncbi:hypothetical protein [Dictyobacter kobayashii]|uniref:Zinc finger Ogr/Delta-type domain-containing protein n=1 Tax=Dictyobacter kobayashii TaxID=2014872 RepID=A0A402AYT6_9CHLR|nr:hypothetical protein [Dictyobacter kobayashii]GCE24270.1 hypothetical protein KDK_80700 [Dictyobacter kobayashii]
MHCPVCHEQMKIKRKDVSYNRARPTTYDRTLYHCANCDSWIKTEVPLKEILIQPDLQQPAS